MSLEDVESWLEANEQDPGFQILSEEKILSRMTAVKDLKRRKMKLTTALNQTKAD